MNAGMVAIAPRVVRECVIAVRFLLSSSATVIPSSMGEDFMAHNRIELNPEVMGGKPVIRGTRVPVEIILRKLGTGMTIEAIIADHPRLTTDDIRAAQAFAADYLADEDVLYS
jgi:uncharacterized protein (DUF433 family)